jgi:hypothetical protein
MPKLRKPITNWKALVEVLEELPASGWAWRGEDMIYREHKSKLDRCLRAVKSPQRQLQIERSVLQRFREHAPNFLSLIEQEYLRTRWSQLVVMQHYSAPTRLLDWTKSVWIAVFFAVSGNWDSPGRVYGFGREKLEHEFRHAFGSQLPPKFVFGRWDPDKGFSDDDWDWAEGNSILFDWTSANKLSNWVVTYYSRQAHFPRLAAQQGLFTFASKPGLDHWERIKSFVGIDATEEITITAKAKLEILQRLNAMGLNGATLFPGADGIGKYIEGFARTSETTYRWG